jgi:hypothetical protein
LSKGQYKQEKYRTWWNLDYQWYKKIRKSCKLIYRKWETANKDAKRPIRIET